MNTLLYKFLKTPVRDLCLYLIGFITIITLTFSLMGIPSSIKSKLEKDLNDFGFQNAIVKNISLNVNGFVASDIALDSYGLDTLKTIKTNVNWFSYLTLGNIKSIQIDGAYITRDLKTSPLSLSLIVKELEKQKSHRIEFTNLNYNILTPFGDLRATGNATITPQDNGYDIKAALSSTQHQMGFESSWHGKMSNGKDLDLFGEIFDGRINMGALKIARTSGWASISNNNSGMMAQLSLNSGSAFFEQTPLQNLSLQSQASKDGYTFSLRSGISGFPSTLAAIDFQKEKDVSNSSLSFETKNVNQVLKMFLKDKNTVIPDKIKSIETFKINAELKPDAEFKGGPKPYEISAQIDDLKPMMGNILIYLNDKSIRGAMGIDPEYTNDLQALFNIPKSSISDNYLRVDGSYKNILQGNGKD